MPARPESDEEIPSAADSPAMDGVRLTQHAVCAPFSKEPWSRLLLTNVAKTRAPPSTTAPMEHRTMFTCSSQGRCVCEPAMWRACTVFRTLRGDGR